MMLARFALAALLAGPVRAPSPGTAPAAPATGARPIEAPSSSESGAEIQALRAELARALSGLRLQGAPSPYRGEVRLVRAELLSLDGSFGGVITDVLDRQAAGAVELRIGSHARDNTNFFGGGSGIEQLEIALDPSASFTRKKAWLALDNAFRGATKSYTQKLVALKRLAGADLPPDYTPAPPPVVRMMPPSSVALDREGLSTMAARLSARFADHPAVDNGDVHVQVLRTHETVMTSEGTVLQWMRDRAVIAVVADTRAADGMHLDHGRAIHLQSIPLPDEALFSRSEALVDAVLKELEEVAAAPMIDEDYDGPILFVGEAAGQLLAATLITEAAGTPAPLGESGRMMELEPGWQKRIGKQVMPAFIDLVDDPTTGFGKLDIDAEGVTPKPLALVDDGRLRALLMTRTPNPYVSGSNGRARMSPSLETGPAITNLALTSSRRGHSRAGLERDLLARAQEDGYEFAYVIESLRDATVLGPVPRENAAAFAGTGDLNLPLPARVFKIEPSGRRTLVRGAVLAPASVRALRRIRAVGNEARVVPLRIAVGAFGGWGVEVGIDGVLSQTVDVQVTTPDLLLDGLELLVERGEHERPPTLVHPLRRKEAPAKPAG